MLQYKFTWESSSDSISSPLRTPRPRKTSLPLRRKEFLAIKRSSSSNHSAHTSTAVPSPTYRLAYQIAIDLRTPHVVSNVDHDRNNEVNDEAHAEPKRPRSTCDHSVVSSLLRSLEAKFGEQRPPRREVNLVNSPGDFAVREPKRKKHRPSGQFNVSVRLSQYPDA